MNGSKWLEENWSKLKVMAKSHHYTEWGELLSQYVLYIDKNWAKFSLIPDNEERLKFSQTWFKNNVYWSNSDFSKSIKGSAPAELFDIEDLDKGEDQFIEAYSESDREDIRLFLLDLHNRHSSYDVDRILLLRKIYLDLDIHNKVLWDLHFTQMLSIRKIAAKLDIPPSSVYNMILELKKEIKSRI